MRPAFRDAARRLAPVLPSNDVKQAVHGQQRGQRGEDRREDDPQPVRDDHDEEDEHDREREQPSPALAHYAQLQRGGGEREKETAEEPGKLATGAEEHAEQRLGHKHRGRRIEVAGWAGEPAVNHEAAQVAGQGESEHRDDRDNADPDRVHDERGQGRLGGPGKHEEEREQHPVEQGAVAALQRPGWYLGPRDRQV